MRIVPEWNEYDKEVKELWDEVQRAKKFIDEESTDTRKLHNFLVKNIRYNY